MLDRVASCLAVCFFLWDVKGLIRGKTRTDHCLLGTTCAFDVVFNLSIVELTETPSLFESICVIADFYHCYPKPHSSPWLTCKSQECFCLRQVKKQTGR